MALISLKNVAVQFRVDAENGKTLKSTAAQLFMRRRTTPRIIHALRSVSLDIESGERVGIIGANGAGKSTLLKVMARIYRPHSGEASIHGHVCPLFEFVTGFEMDANGWDNIRTRALLLGMSAAEIDQKIHEIAAFTHLDEFLDYPVRCYSSGMLLRLAFAASTAVDPEILLLDEVVAAGDAAFMEQAKRRMDELLLRANIVVFVSHSLSLVESLCDRVIWLDRGTVMFDGPCREAIPAYERHASGG
ncbi:MAG: ABC transporter ATP-binding protein [Syntrophobacteraceae bacterium]|jgi:lipopolysaccharide transport system ATP-binding protein|nr:ABC transporter ATP-binding protein [Syntrophobacteraceae bacterium]